MTAATATMAIPPSMVPDAEAALAAASACGPPASTKHRPAPFKDLKTPLSAHPPIQSPLTTSTPSWMKREPVTAGGMKTPVTPPSAYLDFLKAMSPNIASPLSTGASTHFSFTAGARSPAFPVPKSASFVAPQAPLSARPSLASHPSTASTSTTISQASTGSNDSNGSHRSAPAGTANTANCGKRVERVVPVPPSPALPPRPATAATTTGRFPSATDSVGTSTRLGPPPRRPSVIIPQSPSSTSFSPSTLSGSYTPLTAVRSPAAKDTVSPVVIRHVVTRTITYTRRTQPVSAHPAADASRQSPAAASSASPRGRGRPRAMSQPLVGEAPKGKKRRVD